MRIVFSKMSLSAKLLSGSAVILAFLVIVSYLGISSCKKAANDVSQIEKRGLATTNSILRLEFYITELRMRQYRAIAQSNPEDRAKTIAKFEESGKSISDERTNYESLLVTDKEKAEYDAFKTAWSQYAAKLPEFEKTLKEGKQEEALEYAEKVLKPIANDVMEPAVVKLVDGTAARASQYTKQAAATANTASRNIQILVLCAVLIGALSMYMISKNITTRVQATRDGLDSFVADGLIPLKDLCTAIGKGDLTHQAEMKFQSLPETSQDEVGKLVITYNRMIQESADAFDSLKSAQSSLSTTIANLNEKAEQVYTVGQDVHSSANDSSHAATTINRTMAEITKATQATTVSAQQIAAGTEQLAGNATDAAEAMNSLDQAIEAVSQSSQGQLDNADESARNALDGTQRVAKVIDAMDRIKTQVDTLTLAIRDLGDKQDQIGAIVSTINDIAEQTNLLALNAAIEAARAGDHGRGFAVVADEVRKLAERSGVATKEIESLILNVRHGVTNAITEMEKSADVIAQGNADGDEAKSTLELLISSAEKTKNLAQQNEKLVKQMSSGAGKLTSLITNVASVSQETAAGTEEMSATTEEMNASVETIAFSIDNQTRSIEQIQGLADNATAIAGELKSIVSQFKVASAHEPSRRRRAA